MQNNIKEKFHICYSSDDKYAPYMGISILSVLKSSDNVDKYFFHILDGGISAKNRAYLKRLTQNINFYSVDSSFFEGFEPNRPYISVNAYYRFLIPDFLDENIDKCLYLDGDTMVLADLSDLFSEQIDGYCALVVEDEGSINQINRLGLPVSNNYFNSGVMLMNLKELRRFDFKNDCMNFYRNNKEIICLEDQDVLNCVLNGKCRFISLKYNANNRIFTGNELENSYKPNDIADATQNPVILHFTDRIKPWNISECVHPLKKVYYKCWLDSPWKILLFKHSFNAFKHEFKKLRQKFISVRLNRQEKLVKICGLTIYKK